MRVLHINSYYNECKFYTNLYDEQLAMGLDLSVYVPVARGTEICPSQFGDYTIISVNHGKYDRWIFHIKHYKILKDIKSRFQIDTFNIIHAHSLFSNGYIAYKLNKKFGIPYIVAVRDTDVNTFFNRMPHLRKLGIAILKHAQKVVFLSSIYKDRALIPYVPTKILKTIIDKSVVIPNGIDAFWLSNKSTETHKIKFGEINIIYAGRLSKRKNISITIKACEILKNRGYKVNFTVVGRVDDEKMFHKLMKYDFVSYLETRPKEELLDIYRANDVFVMPSRTETFGLVYAEAMSQGLPIIYSKGQGFDGQFEEGIIGYHVDCNNAEEIADRIINVVNNYERLSENCVKFCDKFDWSLIAQEHEEIYLDC